jgi:threonine dehydrogenase-like Zn-dependent dehydrogenase
MIAVRCFGANDLRMVEEPLPVPGSLEVRVRPLAVGLCGTDQRIIEGAFPAAPGVVLGHEICGTVDALGTGVANVREGDLVTIEPHLFDGSCRYCRLGLEHMCIDKRAFGVHLDGGMAEAVVVPAKLAYPLPSTLDPRIGAMTEPLACAIHGIDRLEPRQGLPLLVIGGGPAGLYLTALCRLAGLGPIVVVEPDSHRREVAAAMGATHTLDPSLPEWRERALGITEGDGYDFLIEAAGTATGVETAIDLAARRARILVYGVARPEDRASIPPYVVYAKELTILGTAINPYTHLRATALLTELGLEHIDTATFPIAEFADAFEAQRTRAATKILVTPQAGLK